MPQSKNRAFGRGSCSYSTAIFLQEDLAIMDLDVKIRSKDIIQTLRDQIAELESLEATGLAITLLISQLNR
jgi:hypothetical protein